MATATLQFNLPEEHEEFSAAVTGSTWKQVCWEIDQQLRGEVKYASDETPEAVVDALARIRESLRGSMSSHGVSFDS